MANAVSPVSMPTGTPLAAPVYLVINDGSVVSTTNGIPVNVVTGTVAILSVGVTGTAVPADADYIGWNSGGNLTGVSTANPLPVAAQHASTIDATNSSTTLLGSGATFTGTGQSSLSYSALSVEVFSDKASASNGLQIEQSQDNTNWDTIDSFTVSASTNFQTTVNLTGKFYRVVYTNTNSAQGTFRLQTVAQTQDVVLPRTLDSYGNLKVAAQGGAATGTKANVASSGSSVTILASNTARKGAVIYNDSTQILYLDLSGGTASNSSYSVQVPSQGYFEVPGPNIYTGLITGIWAAANGNARVTEFS